MAWCNGSMLDFIPSMHYSIKPFHTATPQSMLTKYASKLNMKRNKNRPFDRRSTRAARENVLATTLVDDRQWGDDIAFEWQRKRSTKMSSGNDGGSSTRARGTRSRFDTQLKLLNEPLGLQVQQNKGVQKSKRCTTDGRARKVSDAQKTDVNQLKKESAAATLFQRNILLCNKKMQWLRIKFVYNFLQSIKKFHLMCRKRSKQVS